jgi:hypothetical protein
MRKSIATALVCLIFPCYLFSQKSHGDKQQLPFHINNIDSPLLVIKGSEFSRFPSTNFLDAVNGLFPWVFSQTPDANNFLFVVNGYVLPDINAISLYDIDEVIFTRNKLEGNLYPLSRAGTFYIKTKTTDSHKPVIHFNSQYNTVSNKESMIIDAQSLFLSPTTPTQNHISNSPGHFTSNQLSLLLGGNKLHLYTSVQLDETKVPTRQQNFIYNATGTNDTVDAIVHSNQYNVKAFLNLDYHFSHSLSAGITGSYFHGKTNEDSLQNFHGYIGQVPYDDHETKKSESKLPYYHLGSFINWEPLPNLRNRVSFEYIRNGFMNETGSQAQYYQNNILVNAPQTLEQTRAHEDRYILRNQLEYDWLQPGKFRLGATVMFSYLFDKVSYRTIFQSGAPSLPSIFAGSFFLTGQKLTTLSPMARFSFSNILSAYAGNGFILNKGLSRFTNHPNSNPYAGLVVDIKNALKIHGGVSRLDISFNYSEMTQNNSGSYWLPALKNDLTSSPYTGPVGFGSVILLPNPSIGSTVFKDKLSSVQLNSGFLHNRIMAGVEWSTLELQRIFLVPIPVYGNSVGYTAVLGKETQTGTSVYLAGKLIDKPGYGWDTRLSVLFPRIKYRLSPDGTEPYFESPVNYKAQVGWQNKFRFRSFYVQANALFGFNRESYTYTSFSFQPLKKEFTEIVLNNLLLGYDLPDIKNPVFKDMSVFIQARNILSSKETKSYYQYDSYAGIGVNIKIN